MGLFTNFLGLRNGRIFGFVGNHVDVKLPPGVSPIPVVSFQSWLTKSPTVLWGTPNGLWAIIALVVYFLFPYDLREDGLSAQGPLTLAFFAARLPLWATLTFGYVAFWHTSLFGGFGWSSRPFIKDRPYNVNKVLHNVFWTVSAVLLWTAFDNVFAFLWASGRLPYVSDADSFTTTAGRLRFIAALMGVPVWRSVHFYFAHRLLHFKPLYQQVHSLHHRNTDIEPFAGLCMHPVEHLYYFACVLPSLVFLASPFAFLWNGVHLLISPAASHSGWEDHFQADAFHYMHHRYFECNYAGSDAGFMDKLFGTFCGSFKESDRTGAKLRDDAKATLQGPPTAEFVLYLGLSALCVGVWAVAAVGGAPVPTATALALATLAGFGPVALAVVITAIYSGRSGGSASQPLWATLGQVAVGSAFCSLPVAWAAYLTLASPVLAGGL